MVPSFQPSLEGLIKMGISFCAEYVGPGPSMMFSSILAPTFSSQGSNLQIIKYIRRTPTFYPPPYVIRVSNATPITLFSVCYYLDSRNPITSYSGGQFLLTKVQSGCSGLEHTNMYTSSLEARVQTSNKEQMYGLVRPNRCLDTIEHKNVFALR